MPESAEFDVALQRFVDLLRESILMAVGVPQQHLRLPDGIEDDKQVKKRPAAVMKKPVVPLAQEDVGTEEENETCDPAPKPKAKGKATAKCVARMTQENLEAWEKEQEETLHPK